MKRILFVVILNITIITIITIIHLKYNHYESFLMSENVARKAVVQDYVAKTSMVVLMILNLAATYYILIVRKKYIK